MSHRGMPLGLCLVLSAISSMLGCLEAQLERPGAGEGAPVTQAAGDDPDAEAADPAKDAQVANEVPGSEAAPEDGGSSPARADAGLGELTDCYSPSQNLDTAYAPEAHGCACTADEEDVCASGVGLVCRDGVWRAVFDGPCDTRVVCADGSPSTGPNGSCGHVLLTPEQCAAEQGIAMSDPGDGSLLGEGCPHRMQTLGFIDAGWDEGGLCCKHTRESCAPQRAHTVGACEPAPRYYWVPGCIALTGCSCVGEDCSEGFSSLEACQQTFAGCEQFLTACGGWLGNTCNDDEFCAYHEALLCGGTDASSVCLPRPDACDAVYDPVCGCDGKTYSNECEANMHGTGVLHRSACDAAP